MHPSARFRARRGAERWRVQAPWGRISPELGGRVKGSLLRRPLLVALAAVNLASLLYLGLIASPVFVSRASMTVLNPTRESASLSSMLSGGPGDGSSQGAYVLKDYVRSWQAFEDLARPMDLAHAFSRADIIGRYGGALGLFQRNDIALWRYYRSRVKVDVDHKSGIASLQVDGFRPGFAQRLARAVMGDALAQMNRMDQAQAQNDLAAAEAKVADAEAGLARTDAALARYRARVGVYDPKQEYASDLSLLNELGGKAAELRSQYAAVRKATPRSPALQDFGQAMAAVEARMAEARARFPELGRASAEYERLTGLRDNQAYLLQQASLNEQQAMRTAAQSRYYLQVISPPSRPDTPELPRRGLSIAAVFLATLLIWGLLR